MGTSTGRETDAIGGKVHNDRAIPLAPQVVDLLGEWGAYTGRQGYIVRSLGDELEIGNSLSDPQVHNIVRKRGAMIGLPTLAPHDLRRTYAQLGYEAGIPITQIFKLLWDSSAETTQRYLNLDLDLKGTVSDFIPI